MKAAPGHNSVLVVDLKRNSLDDGPGIRSVVFFKGCTLRCVWCQNPEALSPRAQIQLRPERCLGCGECTLACPEQIAGTAEEIERAADCRVCAACVAACPAGARRVAGVHYEPDELFELLAKDEPFYRNSGGGVTLSGGEPAMYPAYACELARLLRARGIQVLIETAGHIDWAAFERHLLPNIDAVYFDLKLADSAAHKRYVGVGNERILENLSKIVASDFGDLLCRVPLVPGITDTKENLQGIAELLLTNGLERVALLPYNPLWISKRLALGMDLPYRHEALMSPGHVARCRQVFEEAGIAVAGK